MCYNKQFENQLLNEFGIDNEQHMSEKDLKDEIDGIEEKIRVLTEEKKKRENEYRRICDLKKFGNVLKEDSKELREFKIIMGCRENAHDVENWTNIIIDDCPLNKISILYPLSVDFDRELRELIYKYINNSNGGVLEG